MWFISRQKISLGKRDNQPLSRLPRAMSLNWNMQRKTQKSVAKTQNIFGEIKDQPPISKHNGKCAAENKQMQRMTATISWAELS